MMVKGSTMNGSGTIRVVKRDGSGDMFSPRKLALAMYRGMRSSEGRYADALDLAVAIQIYLSRSGYLCISSAAIFEMAMKVLRRVRMAEVAETMEAHWRWREGRRRAIHIVHAGGNVTMWDKSWLAELARRSWHIMPSTARIIAGQIEMSLLQRKHSEYDREYLIERLNARVAEYGLADAVPVR